SAAHTTLDGRITVAVTGVAIAGSLAGVRASHRLSAQCLRGLFGWFVILIGVFILAYELG
ncbi:MAG TPA: hypothetical protein VHN14_13610, partial [Kofleriaceae bacterium]|nr:hypothetical protein [Kofleriaceae bacterium]